MAAFANERSIPVHMDGARLFNAAIALEVPPANIAQYADTLQFCLSKGLGAPIGSVVVGPDRFIQKVRRIRKMLGGGMRQVGVIASAGIVALEENIERLLIDHANARHLAEELSQIDGIEIDLSKVQTNIVIFRVVDKRFSWQSFLHTAKQHGLLMSELGYGRIRAVTHQGVSDQDIERAIEIIRSLLQHK